MLFKKEKRGGGGSLPFKRGKRVRRIIRGGCDPCPLKGVKGLTPLRLPTPYHELLRPTTPPPCAADHRRELSGPWFSGVFWGVGGWGVGLSFLCSISFSRLLPWFPLPPLPRSPRFPPLLPLWLLCSILFSRLLPWFPLLCGVWCVVQLVL